MEGVGSKFLLRFPHILALTLVSFAWIVNVVLERPFNPLLHIVVAAFVLMTLSLILSEYLDYPDPYEADQKSKRIRF